VRATVYTINIYGRLFRKEDVRLDKFFVQPIWAQYEHVPVVCFRDKGKCRTSLFERSDEARYILVLSDGYVISIRDPKARVDAVSTRGYLFHPGRNMEGFSMREISSIKEVTK
jgi:hypothetical protein